MTSTVEDIITRKEGQMFDCKSELNVNHTSEPKLHLDAFIQKITGNKGTSKLIENTPDTMVLADMCPCTPERDFGGKELSKA